MNTTSKKSGIPELTHNSGPKCSEIEARSASAQTARKDYGYIFKSKLIFAVKTAVAVVVIWFLMRAITPSTLVSAFRDANGRLIAVAVALLAPNILVQVLKWLYILRMAHSKITLRTAYDSLIVGFPLGFVTPGRLGEIGRALFVKQVSQFKTLRLVIVDKIANLIVIIAVGTFGLLMLARMHYPSHLVFIAFCIWGLAATTLLFFFFVDQRFSRLTGGFARLSKFSRRDCLSIMVFSALFYGVYLCQFVILVCSFEPAGLADAAEAIASVILTKTMLPISFADVGVREGAAMFYLGKVGISRAAAFNAAFLLFAINVCVPSLLGLPILLKTAKEMKG